MQGGRSDHTYSESTDVVYQDGQVCAFVSSHQWPNNPGNVLVAPVEHYENIYDLPVEVGSAIQELVRAVAIAMKVAWCCEGVSTRQHNEPAGGQDVWHYHVHVTPRFEGDCFYATYASERALMPAQERAQYASELRDRMVEREGKR
jgi:histidine triad (HIT) family protein